MSRQEVYSWASLLSNLAFLLVYLALFFGIPSILEPWTENLTQALILVIFVDLVFQSVISIQKRRASGVEKDERDQAIEAEGFKIGYWVFLVSVVILIGHLFTQSLLHSVASAEYLERMRMIPLHFLVIVLIAGTSAKSILQIVRYRV